MKKHIQFIIILSLLINGSRVEGQETSISNSDVLAKQISELEAQKNFIRESACPIKEVALKEYEANFVLLNKVATIAQLVYNTPLTIKEASIKEQKDKTISYRSTNMPNVIVKRHTSRVSMAGLVSDNSSIVSASRLFYESFSLNEKEIKAYYFVNKNSISLLSLQAIYPNKDRVFIDLTTIAQSDFEVFNTTEYGSEFKKLRVQYNPSDIGKIYWIETPSYELYTEQYYEALKDMPNRKIRKYRYAVRCYDDKRELITPTKAGGDIAIKPTTYLLWYKGFLDQSPIKTMLKRSFEKGSDDKQALKVMYGYDSKKEWHHLKELPSQLLRAEEEYYPNWDIDLEKGQDDLNNIKTLEGKFSNFQGNPLPITLTLMSNTHSDLSYKAKITNELTPSGNVKNEIVKGITIYRNQKEIQYIALSGGYTIDYFKLGYVDINYDGYLDLIIDSQYYIYMLSTQTFEKFESEDEYFPYLTELSQYNLFDKSYIAQHNRSMIEYRANMGQISPYHASSYYPNAEGDIVALEEKFENGKWVTVEERIEHIDYEEEDEEASYADEVDITSPNNYALITDLTCYDGELYFSPNFYNNTDVTEIFKQPSKLFVEVTDSSGVMHQQYLYDVTASNEQENMLDDSAILFNGKNHFLNTSVGLIPFFPLGIKNGDYSYRLKLEQPLFGEVYSNEQKISLPLALKKNTNIIHLNGTIDNVVKGDLYLVFDDSTVKGTFINAKTDQRIKLKGEFITGFFGADDLNLEEYEKESELSGYFEGGYKEGVYKGYWLSKSRKIKVPFEFKMQ